jgi:hypothetical protein
VTGEVLVAQLVGVTVLRLGAATVVGKVGVTEQTTDAMLVEALELVMDWAQELKKVS